MINDFDYNHSMIRSIGRAAIVSAIVLIFGTKVMAQQQSGLNPNKLLTQYIIDVWTTDNGLSNNSILDIEKTSDGYLWIATYGGLSRFDGTDFKEFPELVEVNGIRSLTEDMNGTLWIGSDDGALIRYQDDQFTFLEIDSALVNTSITSITADGTGKIWVGTRSGMAFVNGSMLQRLDHPVLSNAFVYCVAADQSNNIWIGTSGLGLYKYYDGNVERFTTKEGLSNNSIRSIQFTDGQPIIGSEGGITFFEEGLPARSFNTNDGLPHNYVNEILEDSRGTIWLGTDGGLVRFKNDQFEILDQRLGLADNTIQALHEDPIGLLWIGTYRGGLNRLKDGKFINYGVQEGLNDELVHATYSDGSRIWIGTGDGLSLLEQEKITSTRLGTNPSVNTIKDILRDTDGNLWIGTSGGLIHYQQGRINKIITAKDGLSNNRVRRLSEDQSGNLWIGTAKGLNKYNIQTSQIEMFGLTEGLSNEFILSLFVDGQNRVWVGTNGGGLFLLEDDGFRSFGVSDGLGSNIIFGLSEDPQGNLWVCTNAGISRYSGENFQAITRDHGLPTNTIFQTITTIDYQWLFTDKGVVRIENEKIDQILNGTIDVIEGIRVLNKSEGMRADQVTGVSVSAIDDKGNILISTLKGLSILNPANLNIGDIPTEVKITSVINDGIELEDTENISFEPGTRYYEFHFTALNFYSPEKIKFRYRLQNFDDVWVDVGNRRTIYYNDIPPGTYTLQVLGSNSDGVWNNEPTSLTFTQQAYFYETRWFYFVLFAVLVAAVYLLYRARVRLLKERNKKLTELVTIKTSDIKNQNEELTQLNHIKDRLFTIISHDLRGPIDSCYSLLDFMNKGMISEKEFNTLSSSLVLQLADVKGLLTELLNWSKSQLDGLTVNPEKINLKEVIDENFKLFESQALHKQLSLKNNLEESEFVNADLNMTKVIVRNLVSNAIKFSENGGVIEVNSSPIDGMIEYSIKDKGVGISKENLSKIFQKQGYTTTGTENEMGTGIGLMLVKEFIEKNKGAVSVESEKGVGSTFKFTLPSHAE